MGDQRWSYNGILPYFRKIEHHWDPKADPKQFGLHGQMSITSVSASASDRTYPRKGLMRRALEITDLKFVLGGNSGSPTGIFEVTENWRNGKRQCSREVYQLDGIEIRVDQVVHRVLTEEQNGHKKAIGVELVGRQRILAGKEVIVSCGSIGTPKL